MDLDKLKTIDDLRNLGITYTPASQKDYTVQELFEIRDLIQDMIDKMPEDQRQVSPWYYGLSPKSGPTDFDKLVNLRGDLISALEDRRRNTAFWSKDDSIDPYGPNPFAEKRSDDKLSKLGTGDQADELPEKDHFGEEPKDDEHFEVPRAGSPEHLAFIEKQNPGTLEKWVSNIMKKDAERLKRLRGSDNHFGEEQAEGLDNLLEGLRDTPHDNRW